jgi:hypothetical protein
MAPKKSRDRKRQTKINFSPASQSSRATASTHTADTERDLRIVKPVASTAKGMSDDSESSEKEEQRVKKQSKSRKRRRETTPSESEGEESTVTVIPRKRQRHAVKVEIESPPRSARRKLKRRRPASEDEDGTPTTPERASEGSASDADNNRDGGEQEELKEELAFLQSSPVADRGRLRSTHERPKNKRQEALEALKRRRAGTTEPSMTPGRRKTVVVDTDSDSELEVIKEEPDSDAEVLDDESGEEQESEREANALDMFQEDQEDEQFIDDTDNIIGEPSANDDLEEMRFAINLNRAKPKELFRHAVEWMVMKKIHPGFDATKDIYTVTFRKLDDEVQGLAGSKFTSSAWTADFTRAIRARPDLMVNDLSASERAVMSPHCEACNRSNHTASSELLLQGQPYNPDTLEPVASDSDSDSDSDSSGFSSDSEAMLNGEKPTYNFKRERIPPESHRFPVGSTCKANAQVAHTLYHWRYHLYQWVKDYLKAEGHLTADKLVKRDGWSDRKRDKAARKIVSRMEDKGQIRELYHSYKNQLTAAMEADNDYKNGWGRRGR